MKLHFFSAQALASAVIISLLPLYCNTATAEEPAMCQLAQAMLRQVVTIRGLSPRSQVPCVVSSRTDVERFLHEVIATQLPPAKLEMEELVYQTIGLVPKSFDYKKGLIALYVSQIGGYYDPEKKQFVMADWIPADLQAAVAVHELTHALQDQHFDLKKLLDPKQENGDTLLAHSAISEGDAMIVMSDYERSARKQSLLREEASIDALVSQPQHGAVAQEEGLNQPVPESLKAILLFPYTSGLRFMHVALRKGKDGSMLDKVFRNPPTTTREILHPEDYWDLTAPKSSVPAISELHLDDNQDHVVYSDVLGEFLVYVTLCADGAQRQQCAEAAQGWIGDRIAVVDRGGTHRKIIWVTRWESERDASEFALAYSAKKGVHTKQSMTLKEGDTTLTHGPKGPQVVVKKSEVVITFEL
jgi:hypothetical protein